MVWKDRLAAPTVAREHLHCMLQHSICKKDSKNCYFAVVEVTLLTYGTVTLSRSHSTATATRYLQYNISIYTYNTPHYTQY